MVDYLHLELVQTLANDDPDLLGNNYPGPSYRVLCATGLLACVGLWGAVSVAPADLASLVRAYRDSPTPARRSAVESYANAHSKDASGALAQLALGVVAYEHKEYPAPSPRSGRFKSCLRLPITPPGIWRPRVSNRTISAALRGPLSRTQRTIALAAFRQRHGCSKPARSNHPAPPKARVSCASSTPNCRSPKATSRWPIATAPANDLVHAAESYQRVYYLYPTGAAATRAGAALLALKDTMGDAYPPPPPRLMLRRPDRLMELREDALARSEYRSLVDQVAGLERDQARVRIGEADFLKGSVKVACSYFRGLDLAPIGGRCRAPL